MCNTGSTTTFLLGGSCLLQVLLVDGHNLVRLVQSLEMTISSPNIPLEILATLLNLDGDAEYSLLVNLKRLDDLQLSRQISIETLHNYLA
ncbi:serine/threonine-protein kinase TOR-like [Solanum pennellii]|uniref:Serine/threonine-protein kinase TOR-like n=1 Tax=Solanum pennellii TaxID=28526 RepID=A0ABM1FDX6_SOLPN|nr:serine/threonine-protein kinase TOR-like [Solanum pennellii]